MTAGYNRVKEWETRSIVAKVLIVDDEPNIREVVALYLRRDGHDVVSAADGEEALDLFRLTDPELVVLDLMLPKLSGLEVCRRMQAERRVPLIMLTARGEEEERIVGLSGRRRLRREAFQPTRVGRSGRRSPAARGGIFRKCGSEGALVRRVAHRPERAGDHGPGRAQDADGT